MGRRKKSDDVFIVYLIMIAVVVTAVSWIYNQIGAIGIASILFIILISILVIKKWRKKKQIATVDVLALATLHDEIPHDKFVLMSRALAKKNIDVSQLILHIKTIRESIEISLNSKNRDTAESRLKVVVERFDIIQSQFMHLISSTAYNEIKQAVNDTKEKFKTILYLNVANGHIDKAKSLETRKSKSKYLECAKSILEEGLHAEGSNHSIIETRLAEVNDEISKLDLQAR